MNFNELKQLFSEKERLIFLEDGKPSYVLISFEDYKNMKGASSNNQGLQLPEHTTAPDPIESMSSLENEEGEYRRDLKLEDLPY